MKEMVYKPKGERVLLYHGVYLDHDYYVISMGTHPCAYVKLINENPEVAENVPCHGGITYNEKYLRLPDGEIKGNFIGWDYAHSGDYMGYYGETHSYEWDGQRYTTEYIVNECLEVIGNLIWRFEK